MYSVLTKNPVTGKFEVDKDEIQSFTEAKKYSITLPSETIVVPGSRVTEALRLNNEKPLS